MIDDDLKAEQFEEHRAHLRAVAYRMLGSLSEADDAVQEAWFRLHRSDAAAIENVVGWLTTVVGRVCIDMLRARQSRREDFVGTWLPEPVVSLDGEVGPEQQALLADSVGLALLVVLESLGPDERLAFVLHDMFAVPFDDIAPMIGRTPAAARQLASRGRRRVRGATPVSDPDVDAQRAVVEAFLAAARAGDFDALIRVLHPDVVFQLDGGGHGHLPVLLRGATEVAERTLVGGPKFASRCRVVLVNGAAGMMVGPPTAPRGVAGITVVNGLIVEIDLILDRAKLAHLWTQEL